MLFNVLPAHAGMIPGELVYYSQTRRAPRACGDDPYIVDRMEFNEECSPRMRG